MSHDAVTCFVADDHPAVVSAVSDFLRGHGVDVTGTARDGLEAVATMEQQKPAVALVDVRMPRLSGIEVARRAAAWQPPTAVILYTAFAESALLTEALDAGARGIVLKEAPLADLLRPVEAVASGRIYVDQVLVEVLAGPEAADALPELTDRERDVLRLLADGMSNEDVGARPFRSPETVRTHVRNAMAKLDADTRTQAVAKALRHSLIS